jgi:hypothetical protein
VYSRCDATDDGDNDDDNNNNNNNNNNSPTVPRHTVTEYYCKIT